MTEQAGMHEIRHINCQTCVHGSIHLMVAYIYNFFFKIENQNLLFLISVPLPSFKLRERLKGLACQGFSTEAGITPLGAFSSL